MKRATKRTAPAKARAVVEELRVRRIVLVDAEGNERGWLDVNDRGHAGLLFRTPGAFTLDLSCRETSAGLTIDHSQREDTLVAGLNAYAEPDHQAYGYGVLTLNDDGTDAEGEGSGNGHTVQAEHLAELRRVHEWMELRAMPPDVRHEATILGWARRGMTDRQWETLTDLIAAGCRAAGRADAEAGRREGGKAGATP